MTGEYFPNGVTLTSLETLYSESSNLLPRLSPQDVRHFIEFAATEGLVMVGGASGSFNSMRVDFKEPTIGDAIRALGKGLDETRTVRGPYLECDENGEWTPRTGLGLWERVAKQSGTVVCAAETVQ